MLFTFGPTSNASNWFQDFLVSMVAEVLSARSKEEVAKTWDELHPPIPVRQRHGLKRRYENLAEASIHIDPQEARQGYNSLISTNFYDDVLAGVTNYSSSFVANGEFHASLKELFSFSFELLSTLKNSPLDTLSFRDELYTSAYNLMPAHLCPFCGLARFDAPHPDMPRHALDHYLPLSAYPMFGAYLPNLVPMCDRCNSSFKLAKDVLKDDNGKARPCVDPHGLQVAKISLMGSEPFGNDQLPEWVVEFQPPIQAFETWDQVFGIRLRYKESVLNADFKLWLTDFSRWASDLELPLDSSQAVSSALTRWANLQYGLSDQGFLKGPMFEMLAAAALRLDAVGHRVTGLVKALQAVG